MVTKNAMVMFVAIGIAVFVNASALASPTSDTNGESLQLYSAKIKPMLQAKCTTCHGPLKQEGGLRLDSGSFMEKGGDSGAVLDHLSPLSSEIFRRLTSSDESIRMPPEGKALSAADVDVVRNWLQSGAKVPANEIAVERPESHWHFQRPSKVDPPNVSGYGTLVNPIDRFIAQEWQARGIDPAPELTDKRVLLRRVSMDLTGLPPSMEQLNSYMSDERPEAYEHAVDRLLESTGFGIRWGRHWMDVWRCCDETQDDTCGNDVLIGQWHMWRMRDWVVNSLNNNKPYSTMLTEMLAGDEIAPTNPEILVATTFIARNGGLGGHETYVNDTVEHTTQAFMGMTFRCARCHDHKYDPITSDDYYRLRSIFEPSAGRTDRVTGQSNIRVDGVPRAYDANPGKKTQFLLNGNLQTPDDSKIIEPRLPLLFGLEMASPQRVELLRNMALPGLDPARRAEEWSLVTNELAAAKKALDDCTSALEITGEKELLISKLKLAECKLDQLAMDFQWYELKTSDASQEIVNAVEARAAKAQHQASIMGFQVEVDAALMELRQMTVANKSKEEIKTSSKRLEKAKNDLANAKEKAPKHEPRFPIYPLYSTGRRTAFAGWLTAKENPMTARVAVNHVWLRHFGRPLVDTVFDFGLRGKQPSHPQLLDYLAADFMDNDWNLKYLHKLIVTSRAYRLQSHHPRAAEMALIDREDQWLHTFRSQRLTAEAVRDSTLFLAGVLDQTLGGKAIDVSQADRVFRRSIYLRNALDSREPMMSVFDAADPGECYRRSISIVPQQVLALTNSRFSFEQSRLIASKVSPSHTESETIFIDKAFEYVLCRHPTGKEKTICEEFLSNQSAVPVAVEPVAVEEKDPLVAASTDRKLMARASLIRVLLNHHHFLNVQ